MHVKKLIHYCAYMCVQTYPPPGEGGGAVPLKIPLNEIFSLITGLCDYASFCTLNTQVGGGGGCAL